MQWTLPEPMKMPEIKSIPEMAFDALVKEIRRFQEGLSENKEVGIVANGAGLAIHVESLYLSGQMIVLNGVDENNNSSILIQHYSQINVQMIAADRLQNEPRRIGF